MLFFKNKGRAARTYLKSSLKIFIISTCNDGACTHCLRKRGGMVVIRALLRSCCYCKHVGGGQQAQSIMARYSGADQVKAPWLCIASRLSRAKIKCSILSSCF